ncbi:NAD-dependent protein deacylase [Flavobacterium columnare NBRC 100251 = ATCC 23463]|uniref:Sir2 family NAD-dependent protein deacetylase n=1 Tax=Flavobacterium columnare TaxID=996 RepID=UPI000BE86255|nr:Sir2 family NAD-dependent protein deacetylase [Flavobacterium columnare]PDS24304.1 NAD-dependent protein deacylase [Flavobacterium columnare NBRC 100251 = ATCC 23463]GEM58373.1 NAD-dependent protein deacylase [Flavobacterium columnare NBRC 100251 = ATCC 23463]
MKKIVVFTGSGISAESGIPTFRDANGLWNNYNHEEISSPAGWKKNKELVLEFFNERRRKLQEVVPNQAHELVSALEAHFDVQIITQNIDDLHERAGSTKVLHIHGELNKMCSSLNKELVYDCPADIKLGDKAPDGSQLRPFVVWFGEDVPLFPQAVALTREADIFIVIGTSLKVYPAANLLSYIKSTAQLIIINPEREGGNFGGRALYIQEKSSTAMQKVFDVLVSQYQ